MNSSGYQLNGCLVLLNYVAENTLLVFFSEITSKDKEQNYKQEEPFGQLIKIATYQQAKIEQLMYLTLVVGLITCFLSSEWGKQEE